MKYNKLFCLGILFLLLAICTYGAFAIGNTPPTADAGEDRSVVIGETMELEGSGSDAENDPLTFAWSIIFKPYSSKAVLSESDIPNPYFTPDVEGSYLFNLKVNDGKLNSKPDTVLYTAVKAGNNKPTANAGADIEAKVGEEVELQGSGSDKDGDTIIFKWFIVSRPENSKAILSNPNTQNPQFTPDAAGHYTIQLITDDGKEDSNPDTVGINALNPIEIAGQCMEGYCYLETRQWCNNGLLVSEGYCENCKYQDDTCLEVVDACNYNEDCESGFCFNGRCAEPTCDDGIKNGYETDVDCGGSCKKCELGQSCNADKDCEAGVCLSFVCSERVPGGTTIEEDRDKDEIPDEWEMKYGLDPYKAEDADLDFDKDGLSNLEEYTFGTNPLHADSDEDGRTDKEEIEAETEPLEPEPEGINKLLLVSTILIIIFGAGSYAVYYFKDNIVKPKIKVPEFIGAYLPERPVLTPSRKEEIREVVKKRRKEKREKRKKALEPFYKPKKK
ncbi:hypothetical protein KY347_01320 [Candidatus Woesearchaeota archaeon]|nr:hypothetical protein [Candidatus Woesearchaeota archaeon]